MKEIEKKALEAFPVKYTDDHRGERRDPDRNAALRHAFITGYLTALSDHLSGVDNSKNDLLSRAGQ